MDLIAILALAVFLLISVVLNGIWRTQRNHLRDERNQLAAERDRLALTNRELENQLTEARTRLEGMDDRFRSVANDVLKGVNEQFQQWAKQTFDGEQKQAAAQLDQRKQAIEQMLRPMRDTLDKHARTVAEIEKHREGAYHGLKQQITSMVEDQRQLRDQTSTLANALRRTDVRGRWGEMTLRRIAEMAGMVPHCDFDEQVTIWKGDDSQRPDMVVHMPSDRLIVVDAKGVGNSYLQACDATDEQERKRLMQQHVRDIESRVRELSGKAYHQSLTRSPDFVVLFIPGESFLYPAVQLRPELIEWALENKVAISAPTTLIGLLRVVEMGWREERLAENAAHISALGSDLHGRLCTAVGYLDNLGRSLGRAVDEYNRFVGSFQSRVIVSARKLEDLHAASGDKLPESLRTVDVAPRQVVDDSEDAG